MSSEVSSEQLCVRKGTGYDEVYPSGQDDPGTSYDERVPSANSPSVEEEKDSDVDRSKSGSRTWHYQSIPWDEFVSSRT
nr:hypothetical protein CFP56_75036 [Quercus suber]